MYTGFERIKTDVRTGLTDEQVELRRAAGAVNAAPAGITPPASRIIYRNVFTLFNFINLALAVLIVLVGSSRNIIFFGVAVFNTLAGIIQEFRAKRTLDKLTIVAEGSVEAVRNGKKLTIPQRDVVQDDILIFYAGDQICADSTVLVSYGLEADESLLTGESANIPKRAGQRLLSGSAVTAGSAYARAEAVGETGYAHSLAREAKKMKKPQTRLMRTINRIIRVLTFVIIPIGALLFMRSLEDGLSAAVLGSAAAMIGMIPEGLVLLTSVALTLGALRLARASALVQTLPGIETLARTDVICLDKTGTITDGTLELTDILPLPGYDRRGAETAIRELLGALPDKNPVNDALYSKLGKSAESEASLIVPFSSERKWSCACFHGTGSRVLGAPRIVMRDDPRVPWDVAERLAKSGKRVLCLAESEKFPELANAGQTARVLQAGSANTMQDGSTYAMPDGQAHALPDRMAHAAPDRMAHAQHNGSANTMQDGQTSILPDGSANAMQDGSTYALPDGLACVALVVLSDAIRPEAADTFKFFTDEGVEIKVISGDDPLTASGVAAMAGIEGASRCVDMSGVDTNGISDADYAALAARYAVFGRTSPRQKMELVSALKRGGRTVCMTGDGVNDVLALKEADCSVAMRNGSGAARGVSDFVLLSEDFSAMKQVLLEGRKVINNIETVSALYMIKTIYSALLSLIYLTMSEPFPFIPLQVTPINTFTVGIPSFYLALRSSIKKPGGLFTSNICSYSLPAALTIVANILFIQAIGRAAGLTPPEMATMRVLLTGMAGFFTLFLLSAPNVMERIMFTLLTCAFAAVLALLKPIFELGDLGVRSILALVPLSAFIPLFFKLINYLSVRGYDRVRRINLNREAKIS